MTERIPVLIAGTVGSGRQNHQAAMWVPQLEAAGLVATGVWTPPTVGAEHLESARALSERFGLPLAVTDEPTDPGRGIIACLRGEERERLLTYAATHGVPVLLDKPTLDSTATLEEAVAAASDAVVLPGHHFAAHPGVVRALAAVRSGEIGLLRAVAADLVVTGGDGPSPEGELRNLGVHLIDLIRRATGTATVTLTAHSTPATGGAGESWAMVGQTQLDVVVSAHVSRTVAGSGPGKTLVNRLRLVGTHGWVLVDLLKPEIDLLTPDARAAVPLGENSVIGLLRQFGRVIAGGTRTAPFADLVTLSRALDAIQTSAATAREQSIDW